MRPRAPVQSGPDEALRVAGRLIVFAGSAAAVLLVLGMLLKPILPMGLPAGRDGRLLLLFLMAVALGVAHLIVTLLLERAQWEPVGLGAESWRPLGFVLSPLGGALVVLVPAGVMLLVGVASVDWIAAGSWGAYALDVFLFAAIVTMVETLLFRGYLQGLLEQRWGALVGVTLPALAFAAFHLWREQAPLLQFVALLALGVFLGAVRSRTGSVVATWLAHLAFTWVQLAVLHTAVPGFDVISPPTYRLSLGAPAIVSGGEWSLERGLAVAGALVLGSALVLWRKPRTSPSRRG